MHHLAEPVVVGGHHDAGPHVRVGLEHPFHVGRVYDRPPGRHDVREPILDEEEAVGVEVPDVAEGVPAVADGGLGADVGIGGVVAPHEDLAALAGRAVLAVGPGHAEAGAAATAADRARVREPSHAGHRAPRCRTCSRDDTSAAASASGPSRWTRCIVAGTSTDHVTRRRSTRRSHSAGSNVGMSTSSCPVMRPRMAYTKGAAWNSGLATSCTACRGTNGATGRSRSTVAGAAARTTFGRIGVKVWIYKGEVSGSRAERQAQAAARAGVPGRSGRPSRGGDRPSRGSRGDRPTAPP